MAILEENNTDNLVRVLVGTKSDLKEERKVLPHEGQELGEYHNSKYFEVSGDTGDGVNEMMKYLVQMAYEKERHAPTVGTKLLANPKRRPRRSICMGEDSCYIL